MTGVILGIDTSCYTTSCAAVSCDGRLLVSEKMLLPVGPGERGLRQSDGVFAHIRQFPTVLQRVYDQIGGLAVCAVGVSEKPTDAEKSYMPVFQVGVSFAQSLATAHHAMLVKTTHQRGHIEAAQIERETLEPPYTALHVSGGTTEFLHVAKDGHVQRFYSSLDLHAGPLFDRVGVRLGLPFPAGQYMEKIAVGLKPVGRYAAIANEKGICLSGAEAAAMRDIENNSIPNGQVAAELYDMLARLIVKTMVRFQIPPERMLVIGGVASSLLLRQRVIERLKKEKLPLSIHFGNELFCSDNAAGIAVIGLNEWRKKVEGQNIERDNNVRRTVNQTDKRS